MGTVAISQFKNNAAKILDLVARTKENIIITRRGKPFARIIPFRDISSKPTPGKLANTLIFETDIVSPLGEEMWDACK